MKISNGQSRLIFCDFEIGTAKFHFAKVGNRIGSHFFDEARIRAFDVARGHNDPGALLSGIGIFDRGLLRIGGHFIGAIGRYRTHRALGHGR